MTQIHDEFCQQYADKNILVLGFGKEGVSTYQFLRECFPDKKIAVMDQKVIAEEMFPDSLHESVPNYLQNLEAYDVVFKTPGIPIWEPALQAYLQQGGIVTSQLNEFLRIYGKQVIGVTGTKGKSTTSSLIAHCLEKNGKRVKLLGNIGLPVFDGMQDSDPETWFVVEMSSYQLETVSVSPHIAVWLNIFEEHLNYHGSMEQYALAKANIVKFQTEGDVVIYNQEQPLVTQHVDHAVSQKKPFSSKNLGKFQETVKSLPKVVQENNVLPAVLVCQTVGLTDEQINAGLQSFTTLPHRLEKVGEFRGITFIDDTLATIPEATIQALDSLSNIDVLILGGYDRGIEYAPVIDAVVAHRIPTVIFFPDSGEKMYKLLQEKLEGENTIQAFMVESMKEAVELSYKHAKDKSVVLLSPASPSFGQFRNYEDKSQQYVAWIKKLAAGNGS